MFFVKYKHSTDNRYIWVNMAFVIDIREVNPGIFLNMNNGQYHWITDKEDIKSMDRVLKMMTGTVI